MSEVHLQLSIDDQDDRPTRRRKPLIERVEGRITAIDVLDRFRTLRQVWYSDELAPFVEGIERQLVEEARLSEACDGLPGCDHPDLCSSSACVKPSADPTTRRLHLWHPEVWWLSPLVRRRDTPLNMRVPLADCEQALAQAFAEHLPEAWRKQHVKVQLEVETHIYWGGCGLLDPDGDGPQIWSPCSFRGDGVGASDNLLEFKRGRPRWLVPTNEAQAPLIRRTLRPGVGLLVAVPVVSFELQEGATGWLMRQARRALRWFGWKQPMVDRDPTFEGRLRTDEAWWSQALGLPPLADADLARHVKQGARLAPASRPAAVHQPGADADAVLSHVLLLHGGLTSARSGWSAWLARDAAEASTRPGPWEGLPLLDAQRVWRFEHDTFLRVDRNINQLIDQLERQVIGRAERGTLVLLAHSRGGNVARFALPRLRKRWPHWDFHALTAGSPHLGTKVFRQIGRRWAGLSMLVGAFRDVASGVLDKQQMTELLILERALAYDIPPGFQDVEPAGVARMAKGQPLPEELTAWGSEWAPPRGRPVEDRVWHRVIEDFAGLEADGDGIVPLHSSKPEGLPRAHDASPVFHTGYFAHPPTVAQIRQALEQHLLRVA
ncbi:hypothetical protein [Caldimonas caldifontis]|uniref:Alpha/beta hydrolase n=1 Tax=Caldimonas caldifontis TaxID=1452508 RepID=A0A2S5SZ62_9BURK|nr:hypothetical protein [Caldimonas caldifontis]PPE68041.1 hypothetical protein C1704_00750 [Caldimonas caldifontis]